MYDKKKVVTYIVVGMSKVPDLNTLKLPLIRTVQKLEIPNHNKGIL